MPNVPRDGERRPQEVNLSVPKEEDKYRLKRLYWVLLEMEKKMAKDIMSVKYADYSAVLQDFTELSKKLKQKGIVRYKYGEHNPDTRVDNRKVQAKSTEESGQSEVSGEGSSSMGAGISTIDPLA